MIRIAKQFTPRPVLLMTQRCKRYWRSIRNSVRSTKDVFTEIYRDCEWGKSEGGLCSGSGSRSELVTGPYVKAITEYLQLHGTNKTIIDLGCGDLEVSKKIFAYCSRYIGVDIVPPLIKKHESTDWGDHIAFLCLDIIEDDLPDGDICILRQVLQHLSNTQIAKILPKLHKYKTCFITEHYPTDNQEIIPNKDIVQGSWIRVYENSAVYLDKPPFNIPSTYLQIFLEVPGVGLSREYDQGVIRTYKLEFGQTA
jgi:hypothetical protein